MSTTFDTVTAE